MAKLLKPKDKEKIFQGSRSQTAFKGETLRMKVDFNSNNKSQKIIFLSAKRKEC